MTARVGFGWLKNRAFEAGYVFRQVRALKQYDPRKIEKYEQSLALLIQTVELLVYELDPSHGEVAKPEEMEKK